MITPILYTKNRHVHGITIHFVYCPERHEAMALGEREGEPAMLRVCPLAFNAPEPTTEAEFNRLPWMPYFYDNEKRQHGTDAEARAVWQDFLNGP